MTPEERRAAVRDLIGQGFKDDEIMGAIEKRTRAKPQTYTDEAGQVVEPGAMGKLPGRINKSINDSLASMSADAEAKGQKHDDYVEELRTGKRQPNFLQRAFPPQKRAEDPIQSDPIAGMIVGGIAGHGAGTLASGLGRIAAGGVGGAVGNVVSGGDPVSGGLIGAAIPAAGSVVKAAGRAAGRAGNSLAAKLHNSPYPRGLDLRVQAEHGVTPTLLGESDPQGAMPNPRRYAPTDSGRSALGETNATELDRRKFLAAKRVKKSLDRGEHVALRQEGELGVNSERPTTVIENAKDDGTYTTGTKQQLEEVRQGLVTPQGSKEDVSGLLAGAARRDTQARGLRKSAAKGDGPLDNDLVDRLEGEAYDARQKARLAAQDGEYSELDNTTVRKANKARDKADHFANEELRLRPSSKQEFPFQQTSASIKAELDPIAPLLRGAQRRFNRRMGGTVNDAAGNEVSTGIQGAEDLIKAQGPETYGTKLKSIGEDTGVGGARLARHNRLKEVYESDIDPLAGLNPGDRTSRLLLSQPQLLLAKQRQSFLGRKPAALPGSDSGGITDAIKRQLTSLGEPFLNRIVYPQANRLGRLEGLNLGPARPVDMIPSLLLSRKDRENGRR